MALYSLNGTRPVFDPERTWIAPGAEVIGKVRFGRDASVWFGAALRGDNEWIEVGERTNIQEHCVLHTDMGYPLRIGSDCTIGHRAILHGCTVGESSLVGMGAIVLNGAKIGPCSLIGAGALVTENKSFPERSLIMGSPARVVRELDDLAVASLKASAMHYAENAKRFRFGLMPLENKRAGSGNEPA
ncbi:MAG: gamma carbonic anhydrase family protein [Methylobacterium mesophilicum]|nr:gamma carbonic anhydrase family protein [Methylobacterium mesophilicum]